MQKSYKVKNNTWFELSGNSLALAPAKGKSVDLFCLIKAGTRVSDLYGKTPSDYANEGAFIGEDITELTGFDMFPNGIFLYIKGTSGDESTILMY